MLGQQMSNKGILPERVWRVPREIRQSPGLQETYSRVRKRHTPQAMSPRVRISSWTNGMVLREDGCVMWTLQDAFIHLINVYSVPGLEDTEISRDQSHGVDKGSGIRKGYV